MGRTELDAHQRMQLEAVLEEFENALRNCADGNLPDVEIFLAGFQGEARGYLEREMRALFRELVRGNYLVLNPIEAGGMGAVSKVRHLRLGKVMALKEIRAEVLQIGDREEVLRRFQREIEACGRLDEHPNLVSYTDTGVNEAGIPFLVMDYIDGEDLGKIVRRGGPLRIADAAQVIHDAAVGLAHAHDYGLVHRDVKPSNIMVSRHGTVKVLDFGLARITTGNHQLTALTTGKVMGTFDYMSPELCRETTPDRRGDIYSLGCTLYYALSGRAPYEEASSQFEKMDAHLHADLPPLPRLDNYPELRAILFKMTAKAPEDRYQDAHEAADALRPFCAGSDLRALVRSGSRRSRDAGASHSAVGRAPREHRQPSRLTGSRAGDLTAEWTRIRKKRTRRLWLTATMLAAGVAVLTSLWIADAWRRAHHRQEMASVLGALPGLNGRWWFDEAPWLLPNVRQELIESLADADAATRSDLLDTLYRQPSAPDAYAYLEELRERFYPYWPEQVRGHVNDFVGWEPEHLNPDDFAVSLRYAANSIDSKPRESLSGAELHVRAVIHHYLQEFEPASQLYEAAEKRYAREGQHALRALCLLDWGELLHTFRRPALAQSRFRQAYKDLAGSLPGEPMPPLFELYAKAQEADAHRRLEHHEAAELLLVQAWSIAATLPENHPLRAFVLERRGWLNLDLWRLEEAHADFAKALEIRKAHEPENHRARHFIYWDLQGVGMAQMYQGDAEAARRVFQGLLDEIEAPPPTITKKQMAELEDRRPNLYERLADTALFRGDGQITGAEIGPAKALEEAIRHAQLLQFAKDGRKAVLIRLQYKAAAVRAMNGEVPLAEGHRTEAQRLEQSPSPSARSNGAAAGGRRASFELTRQIALDAMAWRSAPPNERRAGRERLMGLINGAGSGLPRDDLLLLLYAGEKLFQSQELESQEQSALAQRLQQLIRQQRFPPENPDDPNSPPRIPGVFRRYLEMAEAYKE